MRESIFVESEFAPLKKVIVSESERTDSILPLSQNYIALDKLGEFNAWLQGDAVRFHADPTYFAQMESERKALVALFEKYGVEVVRPRKLTEEEKHLAILSEGPTHGRGMANFFVRDPFIVAGEHVVEANFRKEYRRFEAETAKHLFAEAEHYTSMPAIDETDPEAGPYLEGGDVMVYHKKLFVGNSGYGSNAAGIAWLRKHLAPYGYEVEEVKLRGHILHLDCAMSLVREGLMVVCEGSFAEGIPETFRMWDRIPIPEEDAEHLAVNGIPVNPDVYITDAAFRESIGKGLEQMGVKVEYIDFSATRREAGSFHCSTQPILRTD